MKKAPISRTSEGVRDALFDEWDRLRSGEVDAQRAIATANLARQILSSVRIEIDHSRTGGSGSHAGINAPGRPLRLGTIDS